jgi:hypothetical protein
VTIVYSGLQKWAVKSYLDLGFFLPVRRSSARLSTVGGYATVKLSLLTSSRSNYVAAKRRSS